MLCHTTRAAKRCARLRGTARFRDTVIDRIVKHYQLFVEALAGN